MKIQPKSIRSLIVYRGLNKVNARNVASRLHNFGQDGKTLSAAVSKHLHVHYPIHAVMVVYSVAVFATAPIFSSEQKNYLPPLPSLVYRFSQPVPWFARHK